MTGPPNNAMNLTKSSQTDCGLCRLLQCSAGRRPVPASTIGKWLLLALFALAAPRPSEACTCNGAVRKFSRAAESASVVVLGRIAGHKMPVSNGLAKFSGADIEVVKAYKGHPASTIRVWGAYGTDCRVPVDGLPDGSTWFLALSTLGEDARWFGGAEATDFYLPMCERSTEAVPDEAKTRAEMLRKIERSLNAR